ncbi:hypothetical protein Tco_0760152 [Tanacetum coccineum]
MRVRQRGELLFELERLGYSPEVYESVKLLKDLQEADMAKARSFMKVIRETKLKEYEAKVVVRSKLKYFCLCKEKLNENRRNLFRNTCFGKWLDLSFFDHEPHLIDYILQKQVFVDDPHYEMPLIYNVEGHSLHFGRPEFSFITRLLFGSFSSRSFKSGDVPFVSRVLPHRLGLIVTNLDLLGVLENEQLSGKLADDDDVRVCLLLALEVIFRGRLLVDEVQDTLMRLVEKIEVWNDFRWGEFIWRHLYDQILNALSKSKWRHLQGLSQSRDYVPTYTLFGFFGLSRCDTSSVKEISLKDRVITELNSRVFKLESIIKVLGHERNGVFVDKLDSGEYFSNLSSEFWDELNHESIELLESPCCGTRLAMVDGDSDDDVVKDYLNQEELRLRQE